MIQNIERILGMLYVTAGAFEHCKPDKHKIKVVCPSIWIHYIISGKGYYNGCALEGGEAFIVHKNDLCEYFPDTENPWSYVWIRLGGSDSEGIIKRCNLPEKSGVFKFDYGDKLVNIAKSIISAPDFLTSSTAYKESVAKMMLSLHLRGVEVTKKCDEEWVAQAKEYMTAHYHKRLSIEDVANAIHIDRRYLRNLFVKHTGKSTKTFLDTLRMERAAELLLCSALPIGIVAMSVGYDDPLSFSKAFKKHFGISPTGYKEKNENA